jgi:hypothetical protein
VLGAAVAGGARLAAQRDLGAVLSLVAALLVAAFVGVVLADPSSRSRQLAEQGLERFGGTGLFVAAVLLAGALLAGATWVTARGRRKADR